jgi:hypothetical protein
MLPRASKVRRRGSLTVTVRPSACFHMSSVKGETPDAGVREQVIHVATSRRAPAHEDIVASSPVESP